MDGVTLLSFIPQSNDNCLRQFHKSASAASEQLSSMINLLNLSCTCLISVSP